MTTLKFDFLSQNAPLATRMRPQNLSQVVGQRHLLAEGKPLAETVKQGKLHSMILWGPPGTGKTTLAEILARSVGAHFVTISAVLAGVKEIRQVVEETRVRNQSTVLFVDEVHRFNKAQQDAFLPHVESGAILLIGATTENPSFELNNALLSRTRVYVLKPLIADEIKTVLSRALRDKELGIGSKKLIVADEILLKMAECADGDARQALNLLEIAADFATADGAITLATLAEVLTTGQRRFDKQGDIFYDQISALHKSVRGSDPDAALYWFARMIDGGCHPEYIARRVLRMASEDIGNADPRALTLALNAWQTYERLGSPEGELALAQAVVYCAVAPKSNAVYLALQEAEADVKLFGSCEVPLHIRNAPTKLMQELGYGKQYRYAHDEPDAFVPGERYLPAELADKHYYRPVPRGLELKIAEKLAQLRTLNSTRRKE